MERTQFYFDFKVRPMKKIGFIFYTFLVLSQN